jgi:hypothetical protein
VLKTCTRTQLIDLVTAVVPSAVVLSFLWLFVAQTYPMMYPGYDIWWHLDVIESVDYFDGQSYGRWHWIWNRVFARFEIKDLFSRALIIHRVQFSLSIGLLYASSWLILSSVFAAGSGLRRWPKEMLATLASVTWFAMHGTSSSTMYGGEASAATLSWIGWYSVSHQITLPLYFLAGALLLHALVNPGVGSGQRWIEFGTSFILIVAVGFLHAAEIPYYLFMAVISFVLFRSPGKNIRILVGGSLVLVLVAYVFNRYSHGNSPLLQRVFQGDWMEIVGFSRSEGVLLVEGLNRGATSWNGLYSLSVLLGVALLLLVWFRAAHATVSLRPLWWVLLSGLMPAMLFHVFTAGILAQITYLTLAWRFSFSSYLFAVPSIYLGAAFLIGFRRNALSGLLMLGFFVFGVMSVALGGGFSPVAANVSSLTASLSRDRMHFGLNADQHQQLMLVARQMGAQRDEKYTCTDIFSSYYLYYLAGVRRMCLPERIREAPGFQKYASSSTEESKKSASCACSFESPAIVPSPLGVMPRWDMNLLK